MVLSLDYLRQNTFLNKTTMTLLERIQEELDYRTNYTDTKQRILFDEYAIEYHGLTEDMTDQEISDFVNALILDI